MSESSCPEASGWYLTRHARARLEERGISVAELFRTLDEPEVCYTQTTYGDGRQVRQRGRLGVVVNPSNHVVITVVFRSRDMWQAHLAGLDLS